MAKFLNKLLKIPLNNRLTFRTFTLTKSLYENYEGDGKTTVTILNKEYKHLIMFDTVAQHGFRLNNGIFVMGPVAAFPRTVLQWNVESFEKMSLESLSLFALLEPKLDLLILGTGDKTRQLNPEIQTFFKALKINTEILPTERALPVFNLLNVEGRCIAGAFFPPSDLKIFADDFPILESSDAANPFG